MHFFRVIAPYHKHYWGKHRLLYAASVKVSYRKIQRRIDVIVEAATAEQAQEKALKQARSIYAPHKKAVYAVVGMVSETEAVASLTASQNNQPEDP